MEINIIKNPEAAHHMGSKFGQDVEPKGTYVIEKGKFTPDGWVEGKAVINKPLTIPINDETLVSWKYEVSDQFKAKGKKLTDKLMAMGFDAIITRYPEGHTGEIILFPNSNFMLAENNTKSLIKKMLKESLLDEDKIKNAKVIAYHGSPTDFSSFSDEFVGGKEATDQNGPGVYFTSSEEEAYGYAGEKGKVYSVELTPRIMYGDKTDRFTITSTIVKKLVMMADDWKDDVVNYDYPYPKGLAKFLQSAFQYNDNDKDVLLQVWIDFYRYDAVNFVRNCVKLGIDGIMVSDEYRDTIHYVIYNPNIVKIIK
jgi:hypothetical protein